MGTTSETLKQKAYHEFKEFLVIALYLWVVFSLFLLYKSVILNEEHISYLARGIALINALALGKFVLIARALHLGDQVDEAPLIYPTLLKAALFSIVLACCKILEDAAVGLYHGKSLAESIADLGGGTLNGILTLTVLLFFMLIPFFAFAELKRVLGEGKLARLFFRPRDSRSLPSYEPPDFAEERKAKLESVAKGQGGAEVRNTAAHFDSAEQEANPDLPHKT